MISFFSSLIVAIKYKISVSSLIFSSKALKNSIVLFCLPLQKPLRQSQEEHAHQDQGEQQNRGEGIEHPTKTRFQLQYLKFIAQSLCNIISVSNAVAF